MIDALVWLQGMSALPKGLVSAAVILFGVTFLVLLWQQPSTRPAADARNLPAAGPVINQNVTSHGQTGGITAHTVNSDAARK